MNFLVGIAVFAGYVWGGWKFWKGYNRTNFEPDFSKRLSLTALWPALFVINKSYRQNFQKALKGR